MQASVALISDNRALQRHLRRTIVSLGYHAFPCTFSDAALADELDNTRDIYVVDLDAPVAAVQSTLARIGEKRSAHSIVLPAENTDPALLVQLLEEQMTQHIFTRRLHVGLARNANQRALPPSPIDEQELAVVCRKLITKEIFGLDKHLFAWGIKLHQLTLTNTEQKAHVLADIDQFLDRLDCHRAIVPAVSLATDELIMNAFFNAPRSDTGEHTHVNIDRRMTVDLDAEHGITVSWGCDGRYFGVAVTDAYGSLTRDTIVHYLRQSIIGQPAAAEQKEQGAGLGLYMIFNSVNHLIFNVAEGERTEVIALFFIRDGGRVFRTSGRSLHIF